MASTIRAGGTQLWVGKARSHSNGKWLKRAHGAAQKRDRSTFAKWLAPFCKTKWVVYAKPPFGGPEQVLAYLSRYTHGVAISNHRLVSADVDTVAFKWKDYRIKRGERMKTMRLNTHEFVRRFLKNGPEINRLKIESETTTKYLYFSKGFYSGAIGL